MKAVKKESTELYTIKHLKRTMVNGMYQICWNFVNASHFLVVMTPGIQETDLETDILPVIEARGEELIDTKWMDENGVQLFLIREQEFLANQNRFVPDKRRLKARTPYQMRIYPCEIYSGKWEVFEAQPSDSLITIPVTLCGEVRYKNVLFSQKKRCILTLPKIEGYIDGLIAYKPSCSRCLFPLTGNSLDKPLVIMLPKSETLDLIVAEPCRQYYNIRL